MTNAPRKNQKTTLEALRGAQRLPLPWCNCLVMQLSISRCTVSDECCIYGRESWLRGTNQRQWHSIARARDSYISVSTLFKLTQAGMPTHLVFALINLCSAFFFFFPVPKSLILFTFGVSNGSEYFFRSIVRVNKISLLGMNQTVGLEVCFHGFTFAISWWCKRPQEKVVLLLVCGEANATCVKVAGN